MTTDDKILPYAGANAPIVVLKFGSSVLSSREQLPEAVSEIYRFVRAGRRVVAVTSAFAGVTDALLKESVLSGCPHDNLNAPAFVAIGEETSAALLALACDRAGMCAIAFKTPELGLLASGPPHEAEPIVLAGGNLECALKDHDVVIVPGFVGLNEERRTVLLGRGGSDLTAVFLGHSLGAERVRLLKDVDGVYDADPASSPSAGRFRHIGWEHAREVAGSLIQARAIDFAAKHNLQVEVGSVGADDVTLVGRDDAPARASIERRKLRVALAGFGTVGEGVAERVRARADAFEIVSVLVQNRTKRRGRSWRASLFTTDVAAFLETRPDVVVDALSCGATGAALTETALRAGIDVVSANKQAIASAYKALRNVARRSGARLLYSAAVGGGAPLLETVAAASDAGKDIIQIEGVWNGTVNFILERLAKGQSFEDALSAAQKAGLAEADPSADLNGADAAAKLHLVSLAAFGAAPGQVDLTVQVLTPHLAQRARREPLKQVARINMRAGQLHGEVVFEGAGQHTPALSALAGDRNAIVVRTVGGRTFTARGRGAGRWPTTESVFADLLDASLVAQERIQATAATTRLTA